MIPIINKSLWKAERKQTFINLVYKLGEPCYQYKYDGKDDFKAWHAYQHMTGQFFLDSDLGF